MSIELDWSEIEIFTDQLIDKINIEPDLVLGIAKVGIIPGTLVSRHFGCNFDIISIFDSKQMFFDKMIGHRHVLFVDDINDSGDTMSTIVDALKNLPVLDWGVAALIRRKSSIYHYGTYGVIVDHDEWFNFPWEDYDKPLDMDKYVEL